MSSSGQVQVTTPASCGNSPRAEVLADLIMAWAEQNSSDFIARCRDDAVWHRAGSTPAHGHSAVRNAVETRTRVEALDFDAIITHGRLGSCSGTLTLVDGTVWAFCHVVRFASTAKTALIAHITTFEVPDDATDPSEG